MIAEIGHFAVLLAFAIALVQSVIPLIGAQKNWAGWMRLGDSAALSQFVLVAISFGALTYSFVVSDFSLQLVAGNSHSAKPMLYKITGVWGNHEGSMLLWILILVFYGALVALFGRNLPAALKARVLAVQSMISTAFLAFLIFTSNPFTRLPTHRLMAMTSTRFSKIQVSRSIPLPLPRIRWPLDVFLIRCGCLDRGPC